jgi:phage-related protein
VPGKGRDGPRLVVVRVFVKKTQKTPGSEIDLALQRGKELET